MVGGDNEVSLRTHVQHVKFSFFFLLNNVDSIFITSMCGACPHSSQLDLMIHFKSADRYFFEIFLINFTMYRGGLEILEKKVANGHSDLRSRHPRLRTVFLSQS